MDGIQGRGRRRSGATLTDENEESRQFRPFGRIRICTVCLSVGVIITRAKDLNDVFKTISDGEGKSILRKYGASTTWMGKLLPRLESRRNGGCPILAVGITKKCITDWEEGYRDGSAEGND